MNQVDSTFSLGKHLLRLLCRNHRISQLSFLPTPQEGSISNLIQILQESLEHKFH
nr:MAG TPA: hypothetical protein [Caudoviricetes sp.]